MHYQISKIKLAAAVLIGVFAPISVAQASTLKTISHQDFVPIQKTKLQNQFVTIPQFNPDLGSLKSVLLRLTGEVEGSAKIENGDAAEAFITANLGAEVSLRRTDGSSLLTVLPTAEISKTFATGDDDLDFLGDSVEELTGLRNSKTEQLFLTDNLGFWIGRNNLDLPVFGDGKSVATGAGNLLAAFRTNAGAKVEVVYDYEPIKRPVKPEPPKKEIPESPLSVATFAALGVGFLLKSKSIINI